ncbi:MAG: amidohydrolase family protein [Gemmatimonadaceae bacterium]|nr:amidohydrolase family protein [Gemmatimonadaceae bacterium]
MKPAMRTVAVCVASSIAVAAMATAMNTNMEWQQTQPVRALVLQHATLIDGTGAPPRSGMTVVLRDGRIASIAPDGSGAVPTDADVRDLTGQWLLPGLIDAHVHLATNPSVSDRRPRVEGRLRNALRGGVVAVRDMAGDARALADLSRAADVGDIESPVISYSALLSGPGFFADPRVRSASAGLPPGTAAWTRAVFDTTDLRQVIAEARGTGARGLKLYADLTPALVAKIAAEAKRQRIKTWAHLALFPAKPIDIVQGGVDVGSHALLLAWEPATGLPTYEKRADGDRTVRGDEASLQRLFAAMKARNMLLEPTLWVYRGAGRPGDTTSAQRLAQAQMLTRAAHAAGVRIVAGTDGISSDEAGAMPNLHEELRLLVESGLTPMDALIAATRHAAEAAGLDATHGTIAIGKAADLLVLKADPLADITNTRQIALVIRRGREVK